MADNGLSSYRRFLQGDNSGLEELVKLYSDELVRYAYCFVKNSAEAEDIMEDTFATLLIKKRRFSGDAPFKAYLFKIARNKSLDYLRSHRHRELPLLEMEYLFPHQPEEDLVAAERKHILYKSLQQLCPDYRDVLCLTYLDGFSIEEVCSVLHKKPKQVYNLLSRSKLALKPILKENGIHEIDQ